MVAQRGGEKKHHLGSTRKYEFSENAELGRGSFGIVYKGKRLDDGKEVAVKKVTVSGQNRIMQQEVMNELQMMRAVQHENIIGFMSAYANDSKTLVYIVMELCQGSLADLLKSKDIFSEPRNIQGLVFQLVEGYSALHAKQILHRDIKPANVLFIKSGNGDYTFKLADLGTGRVLQDSYYANTAAGTLQYLAPEVLRGFQGGQARYDARADVWSLGVLFCETATKKRPDVSRLVPRLPPNMPANLQKLAGQMVVAHSQRIQCEELFRYPYVVLGKGIHVKVPGSCAGAVATKPVVPPKPAGLLRRPTGLPPPPPNPPPPPEEAEHSSSGQVRRSVLLFEQLAKVKEKVPAGEEDIADLLRHLEASELILLNSIVDVYREEHPQATNIELRVVVILCLVAVMKERRQKRERERAQNVRHI